MNKKKCPKCGHKTTGFTDSSFKCSHCGYEEKQQQLFGGKKDAPS